MQASVVVRSDFLEKGSKRFCTGIFKELNAFKVLAIFETCVLSAFHRQNTR
jgi:hypothetical protein